VLPFWDSHCKCCERQVGLSRLEGRRGHNWALYWQLFKTLNCALCNGMQLFPGRCLRTVKWSFEIGSFFMKDPVYIYIICECKSIFTDGRIRFGRPVSQCYCIFTMCKYLWSLLYLGSLNYDRVCFIGVPIWVDSSTFPINQKSCPSDLSGFLLKSVCFINLVVCVLCAG
jgi:hypothetical protein